MTGGGKCCIVYSVPTYSTIDEVRDALRPLIEKAGIRKVAEAAGINNGNLSRWLSSNGSLSIRALARVAGAVGKDLATMYRVRAKGKKR